MIANKYGNFLTVVLIIVIVGILVGIGIFVYNKVISPNITEKKQVQGIAEFEKNIGEDTNNQQINSEIIENVVGNNTEQNNTVTGNTATNSNASSGGNTAKKRTYYDGFIMLGYITISKTNVKLPIIKEVTPKALDTAVGVLYPSNPKLNEPGNTVIVGHNYRNGKFFSNNDKLSIGDKIKIKDETSRELIYTIYNKFETTPEDTSFYGRDTQGAIEITLSTCTDDSKARIIILARVEQ